MAARLGVIAATLLPPAVTASAGCNTNQADVDARVNAFVQDMLIKRTPQQRAIEALQADNPDDRRKQFEKIVGEQVASAEWAVKLFASVARTDRDAQVRCIAIKGLRQAGDERVVEPLLMILNHREFPEKVVPPQPEVRWEATEAIQHMSELDAIPKERREWAQRTLVRLVTEDPDRNVRIWAARGLGNYPHPDVLTALIRALEVNANDFGVRYEAENSLERLTGRRNNYDPDAWREWLAKNPDPFVKPDAEDVEELGTGQPPPVPREQDNTAGS